jgi:hypothetical protein
MADEEKLASVRELKGKADLNAGKMKQVRVVCLRGEPPRPAAARLAAAAHPPPPPTFTPAQVEAQRRQAEVTLRRAAYTAAHLSELPDDVRTYASVGKAYVLEPKAAAMARLESAVKGADAELKGAAAAREALARAQESLNGELKELVGSLRAR